jgi:phospholipid/cholesterol/gamma-HCH transport system ATP-binding protein
MIDIINLQKTFEDNHVLRGVNLTIETGETMVIIGRSGCGKSVLLKHIVGLTEPDSGQIFVDGTDIKNLSRKRLDATRAKFGFLFQGAALFDSLTVEENVAFALLEREGRHIEDVRDRVRECLGLVGLEGVEQLMPSALSGGMRKRVGLARAICMNPTYMLYDEPTTGLDPVMSDVINDLIVALRDRLHVTSIVVTHDMTSAYKIGDRIAMLHDGQIIAVGTPDEVRQSTNPIIHQFITGAATGPIKVEGQPMRT